MDHTMSILFYSNPYYRHVEQVAKKNKVSSGLYVINMFIVYALWKAFNYYVNHSHGYITHAWAKLIYALGTIYASVTSMILNVFGESTKHSGIGVYFFKSNKLVTIEDHCLAIPATIIFIGTVALFKGKWQNKIWFIPLGVALIVLINIVRLVLLCYSFEHFTRYFFDINHSLIYVIITYTLVFLLIVTWMRKFAYWQQG